MLRWLTHGATLVRPLIILFAKAPRPGFVKTRLQLPPARAAEVHDALVRSVLKTLMELLNEADLELSTDVPTDAWSDFAFARSLQSGGDLGERLYSALAQGLATGREQVMVVGSDSPMLPVAHLRRLLASPVDVALGPTEDGGYYAIACRSVAPEMFDGVRWSTPDALEDTARSAALCGLRCAFGPVWFDVDTPEDLERIREKLAL